MPNSSSTAHGERERAAAAVSPAGKLLLATPTKGSTAAQNGGQPTAPVGSPQPQPLLADALADHDREHEAQLMRQELDYTEPVVVGRPRRNTDERRSVCLSLEGDDLDRLAVDQSFDDDVAITPPGIAAACRAVRVTLCGH